MSVSTELREVLEVWLTGECPMNQPNCRSRFLCWHCFENMMVDLDLGPGPRPTCCVACRSEWNENAHKYGTPFSTIISQPMFVCPTCGNKRCAKALDHTQDCNT